MLERSEGAGRPRALIIAGPNGAGKTTFAREFLVGEGDCLAFINADLIAVGISPFDVERAAARAARLMLELVREHVEARLASDNYFSPFATTRTPHRAARRCGLTPP